MLHKLIGTENSVATSLHALMSDHGTVGLVGRTMAIMYDAHLPQKANGEKALEVLKSISGGDPQTINRKFHDEYTTLLTARVVMICNEIPRFNDTGDALLNRLLPFKFDISFNGREDHELETKLTHELEGIAIWALEGIKRYVTRGKLMTPREAVQDVQDLKRILNPVSAFAEDCMVMPTADPKEEVSVIELYQAYIDWADDNYMNHKLSKDRLLSKVRAIAPMIKQVKRNGVLYWKGMKLRDGANVSSQLF
jgi:putative DNA primase/helicase